MHTASSSAHLPGKLLTDILEMKHPRKRVQGHTQQTLSPVVRHMCDLTLLEDKALLPASWVFKTLLAPDQPSLYYSCVSDKPKPISSVTRGQLNPSKCRHSLCKLGSQAGEMQR